MLKSLMNLVGISTYETRKKVELHPLTPLQSLRVALHNGRITLRQWEHSHLQADVHVKIMGGDFKEGDDTDRFWRFAESGDEALFEQLTPDRGVFKYSISVHVDLCVPRNLNARLRTHNGSVEVRNCTGSVEGLTHNGAVELANVIGDVEFTTHNGRILAEEIQGHVRIQSHNGELRIARITGNVFGETHNGAITLNDFGGRCQVETHNGAIDIRNDSLISGDWSVCTHNGAIQARLSPESSAVFQLASSRGRIGGNLLPMQVKGIAQEVAFTLGEGTHTVRAKTSSGAISFDRF